LLLVLSRGLVRRLLVLTPLLILSLLPIRPLNGFRGERPAARVGRCGGDRVFRLPDGDLLGIALVDAQIPHEATVLPGPWKEARRDDASFDRGEVVHEHSEPAELLRS